jgi:nicotinate phosphoribosyltransferase
MKGPQADQWSSALLTDLYQLTMACAYWRSGTHQKEAVFNLFFREHPFGGGFTVACGLHGVIELLRDFRFTRSDLDFLAGLTAPDGKRLFPADFLEELKGLRLECDVDAIPEGTVVFPHEPLLRVRGPILHGQLLETLLLNQINFPTLVATKAARVCLAAQGEPVLEFGLRRAQGSNGALAASRAAYLGGCAATSNVLAGKLYGIPVRGTHAHSWVMSFGDELEAFEAYAKALPNNCVFLVDTYDSLDGVRNAVAVGRQLRAAGHELAGVRLDSGDLAWLSVEAREILDAGGFPKAFIVASNDLDEHLVAALKAQGAAVNVWGVGTRLVTAYDQPALGGVYKLAAVRERGGPWQYKVKLSEQAIKASTPGLLQVRRFLEGAEFVADALYDMEQVLQGSVTIVDPLDATRRRRIPGNVAHEDLLAPVFRRGRLVYREPSLEASRRRVQEQLAGFHAGIKRFPNPHPYPVGLELGLHRLKTSLILSARRKKRAGQRRVRQRFSQPR